MILPPSTVPSRGCGWDSRGLAPRAPGVAPVEGVAPAAPPCCPPAPNVMAADRSPGYWRRPGCRGDGNGRAGQSALQQTRLTDAANQLSVWPHIDKSPGPVFGVHGVLIGLPQKPHSVRLFGQIVNFGGVAPELAIVEADSARILLAAPHRFCLALTASFGEDIRHRRSGQNQNCGDHEYNHDQGVTALLASARRHS